jgi:hypothetical protein
LKRLLPVGFFRELSDDPDEQLALPSLGGAVSASAQENEEKIVAYLQNGICLGARGCYVEDVLDPSSKAPLFSHTYTDGTYFWRSDLAHYVEKYHLRLPPDFVRHMAAVNWQIPAKEQVNVDLLEV